MKRILSLLCLCAFSFVASAATRTTEIITITNAPANANTITINGTTLTWKTTVVTPSTEIAIGADSGTAATNLFRHLASYQLSGPVTLDFTAPNIVKVQGASGQSMSASLSAAYGTVGTSAKTDTPLAIVRVPFSSEPAVPQTNNPTLLVQGMETYSQAAFTAGTALVANLVQTTGNQTVAGNKTITGTTTVSGELTFSSTSPYFQFYDSDGAADAKYTVVSGNELGMGFSFYNDALTTPHLAFYIARSGAIPTSVTFISPVIATTFQGILTNSVVKQITLAETNYSTGIFGHTRANNTSLANGNNATIDFGAKVFVKIKAGPTGAFAICGIAGGADGRELILYNATGQNMTIANDSGVEPTAANRIYTNTGADLTATTGNGMVRLIYDSEDSRWIVVSYVL